MCRVMCSGLCRILCAWGSCPGRGHIHRLAGLVGVGAAESRIQVCAARAAAAQKARLRFIELRAMRMNGCGAAWARLASPDSRPWQGKARARARARASEWE